MNCLGIDFGTCRSSAAVLIDGKPCLVNLGFGSDDAGNDMPTAIYVESNGQMRVGEEAVSARYRQPGRYFDKFKLRIGQKSAVPISGPGFGNIHWVDLVAALLLWIRKAAETQFNNDNEFERVVLTVPALYAEDGPEWLAMKDAAIKAGFSASKTVFVREPYAAATYYHHVMQSENGHADTGVETILVYDLGGGTFDPALLRRNGAQYEFLGIMRGETGIRCGGIYFDEWIRHDFAQQCPDAINFLEEQAALRKGDGTVSAENLAAMRSLAVKTAKLEEFLLRTKHKFGHPSISEVNDIEPVLENNEYTLTRNAFYEGIGPLLDKTITCCRTLVESQCGLQWTGIDRIIPVGGSCHIPLVREKLAAMLQDAGTSTTKICWTTTVGKRKVVIDPLYAVSLGAALCAEQPTISENPSTEIREQGPADTRQTAHPYGWCAPENEDGELTTFSRTMRKCDLCGHLLDSEVPFCSQCGNVFRTFPQVRKDALEAYRTRVDALASAIASKSKEGADVLWDETVHRCARAMKTVTCIIETLDESLPSNGEKSAFHERLRDIEQFLDTCRNPVFHVAFVGTVNAGKSTLINALFERELASTRVTPETASLTIFRSAKENHVRVTFYTSAEWKKLWATVPKEKNRDGQYQSVFMKEYEALNADSQKQQLVGAPPVNKTFKNEADFKAEIEKWTSSKHATHYFVKQVEVGMADFEIPEQVVIVDTPGLNDPVSYRSNITKEYISRANSVVVCVPVTGALTGQDMHTILSVFANTRHNPEKVFIVGTQLDRCNAPDDDWSAQKDVWMKYLSGDDCYGSALLASRNMIGVAAYLYTLLAKYSTTTNLTDQEARVLRKGAFSYGYENLVEVKEHLCELSNQTGMGSLKNKLIGEVLSRHKEFIQADIIQGYFRKKEGISTLLRKLRTSQSQILSAHDKSIAEITDEMHGAALDLEEAERYRAEIQEILAKVKDITQEGMRELLSFIDDLKKN